jgi:hypothetical protein
MLLWASVVSRHWQFESGGTCEENSDKTQKRDLWRASSGCLHREVDYRTRLVVAVAMGAIAVVF